MPFSAIRVILAKEFHWTLDYIDSLDVKDVFEILQILDGINKANA